jgi:hypothetical protein
MQIPSEQEIRKFVGPNAAYYLEHWAPLLRGERRSAGFNYAALIFSAFWLPFRQMWRATLFYYGALVAGMLLLQWLLPDTLQEARLDSVRILPFAGGLVCGFFGNAWYLRHTCRVIDKLKKRELPEDAYKKALEDSGGGSLAAALGMAILWSGFSAAFVILNSDSFQARRMSAALSEAMQRGPGTIVDFAQVIRCPWDKVYFFPPYTPLKTIEARTGCAWPEGDLTTIEWNERINLVVFVRGGRIVQWFEHPRTEELEELASRDGYARNAAKFAVERFKVGIGVAPGLEIRFDERLKLVPPKS